MHRTGAKKPEGHAELAGFLTHPDAAVDMNGLCAHFRVTRVTFTFRRPPDLDTGLRLPSALRGALGRQIHQIARERRAAGDGGPQLWHALFADHPWPEDGGHFPKPFVIWITPKDGRLFAEISLFGEAGLWRDDLIEAMARVMLPRGKGGEGGVTLDGHTRARRIWPLEDIYWRVREGIVPPPPPRSFVLSTITPLITGADMTLRGTHAELFASLVRRIAGLARWHGLDLKAFNKGPERLALCQGIIAEALIGPRAARYERRSRTFGKTAKQENGIMGHYMIRDYPEVLWPCFVLGTLVNMGFSIPQGAGRIALSDP